MAHAIRATLNVVWDASGAAPGTIDPANVPSATCLLGELVTVFADLETDCKRIARELQESIDNHRAHNI